MMFVCVYLPGGGCGIELANWIIDGRPQRDMFSYDIRSVILFSDTPISNALYIQLVDSLKFK